MTIEHLWTWAFAKSFSHLSFQIFENNSQEVTLFSCNCRLFLAASFLHKSAIYTPTTQVIELSPFVSLSHTKVTSCDAWREEGESRAVPPATLLALVFSPPCGRHNVFISLIAGPAIVAKIWRRLPGVSTADRVRSFVDKQSRLQMNTLIRFVARGRAG